MPLTTIFFDIGGVLLTDGWGHQSRRAAAEKFGLDWDEYNAEQQASIVEDWYWHGQTTTDPLYGYVRDQIWQKHIAPDDSIWDNAF